MIEFFNLGASLSNPKPRPYKIEDRHKFSPDEADFDRVKNHSYLKFICLPDYQSRIDEVAWLDIMSGDPKYLRDFVRNYLFLSEFRWPWMENVVADFDNKGGRPKLWKSYGVDKQVQVPVDVFFQAWVGQATMMTRAISDMRNFRSILEFDPNARFIARLACDDASPMEQELCRKRNDRLTQAIIEDDLDGYLSGYPLDYCTVDYFSERQAERLLGLKAS
ncbi:hypothetical protein [Gluconobacter morbifer]|uniref:hypothetical protein n=1 Tax=Gluconobacter morbifer TaxID=479935 RepID=UPI001111CCA6|nr:hypothetical protein [Gluconobacter morbifer]